MEGFVGCAQGPRFRGCIEISNAIFVQRQTWCFLPSEDAMGNQPYWLKQKLIWTKQVFRGERTLSPKINPFKSWHKFHVWTMA